MHDLIGIGLAAWDTVCLFDCYPAPNQKVTALKSIQCGGGPVPTALAVLSRLGGKAAFIGSVGDDEPGRKVIQDLSGFGVDTRLMTQQPGATPCAYIWVDGRTGDRTVALVEGGNAILNLNKQMVGALQQTRFLLIDGRWADVCIEAAEHCRRSGGEVILDAGSPRTGIRELLAVTDHAVVSADFLKGTYPGMEVESALREIALFGTKTAVVTQGQRGGVWWKGGQSSRYPVFKVNVLDTTGAGDAFHGGYIYGLAQGWDIATTCRFASAVAAMVCQGLGGRATAPTLAGVNDFIATSQENQP